MGRKPNSNSILRRSARIPQRPRAFDSLSENSSSPAAAPVLASQSLIPDQPVNRPLDLDFSESGSDGGEMNQAEVSVSSQSIPREEKSEVKCRFSFQDLQRDGLKLLQECPFCHWLVHEHTQSEKIPASEFTKVVKDAYKILKDQNCTWPVKNNSSQAESSSKMFFQKIEMLLRSVVTDSKVYVAVLPLITNDHRGKLWVDENIVSVRPALSWEESKKKFSDHFDSRSLREDLRSEYRNLRQRQGETVQSFAEKFTYFVRALDFKDENFIISDFKNKLLYDIQMELTRAIGLMPGGESKFYEEYNTSELFIEKCIDVDRIFVAMNQISNLNRRNNSDSETPSRRKSKKRSSPVASNDSSDRKKSRGELSCSMHGLGNHSTEQCKTLKRQREAETINSEPKVQSSRTISPPSYYVCKICNIPGHFRNDCPKGAAARETSKPNDSVKSTPTPPGTSKPGAKALAIRSSTSQRNRAQVNQYESDSPEDSDHSNVSSSS